MNQVFLILIIFGLCCILVLSQEITLAGNYRIINSDVEIVYQLPPAYPSVAGIVFLAHGCSHSATDWWPRNQQSCPSCIGLPVERSVVSAVLSHGYLAVAQSSYNRQRKCWDQVDVNRAVSTIQFLITNNSLASNTPIHLFGASSGGAFVGRLALRALVKGTIPVKITSAVVQIMPIHIEFPLPTSQIPGLLFMHMARDEHSAKAISALVVRANSRLVQEIVLHPLQVTTSFFHDHANHLTLKDSEVVVAALSKAGYLNSESYIIEDPRQSDWRDVVRLAIPHIVPSYDSLVADSSGISELLNLAYSIHEISDFSLDRVLDFMKKMEI